VPCHPSVLSAVFVRPCCVSSPSWSLVVLLVLVRILPGCTASPGASHHRYLGMAAAPVPPVSLYGPSFEPMNRPIVRPAYAPVYQQGAGPTSEPRGGAPTEALDYAPFNQPYHIGGRWFSPRHQPHYDVAGRAALSRNPLLFVAKFAALHATLPVPSLVEITNLENDCNLIIRIVGRGATRHDQLVELSPAAASLLRIKRSGDVRVKYLAAAPLDGSDVEEQIHVRRYPGLGCTR
jgi:hypothetical protein